jgi:hypothetical protein
MEPSLQDLEEEDKRLEEEVYAAYLASIPRPAGTWTVHVPFQAQEPVVEGTPYSYLESASKSNMTVVFLTGFAGTNSAYSYTPPRPGYTPGSYAFAFTTRSSERATGFATRAAAANWTVIFVNESFTYPDKPEWMKWNLLMKQVRVCHASLSCACSDDDAPTVQTESSPCADSLLCFRPAPSP